MVRPNGWDLAGDRLRVVDDQDLSYRLGGAGQQHFGGNRMQVGPAWILMVFIEGGPVLRRGVRGG
jgi:hypothetical protein